MAWTFITIFKKLETENETSELCQNLFNNPSLITLLTHHRSFRRRYSQPIAWLVLVNQIKQQANYNTNTPKRQTHIPCLKNCAKLFLSEFRKISTNFDNFWLKDDKEAEIMLSLIHI